MLGKPGPMLQGNVYNQNLVGKDASAKLSVCVCVCVLDADSVMIRKDMLAVAVAVCSGQTMVASPGSETDLQIRLLATCMQSNSPKRALVLFWEMMEFCSDTLVD